MEHKVPEDILREILKEHLSISSTHAFLSDSRSRWSHFGEKEYDGLLIMPRSDALLVSKHWLRVGTPLFYRTIIVYGDRQVKQLAQVLRANPDIGNLIRNARLEGGYGKDLLTVVKHTPRLHSLALNICTLSRDSTAGLLRALSHINPTCLYLHELRGRRTHNQKSMAIRKAFFEAIGGWTSLEAVHLPNFWGVDGLGPVLDALVAAPALKSISLSDSDLERYLRSHEIFKSSRMETIICRGIDTHFTKFMEEKRIAQDIRSRVVYEETEGVRSLRAMIKAMKGTPNAFV